MRSIELEIKRYFFISAKILYKVKTDQVKEIVLLQGKIWRLEI